MYKIFVNDNPFVIMGESDSLPPYTGLKVINESDSPNAMIHLKELESLQHKAIAFVCSNPSDLFQKILKEFIMIKAAGGVVFNEHKQVLIIKRLGKWDLPKGKIDPHESTEHAALREVEEECGIGEIKINKFLTYSYHTYKQQGYRFIKQTTWYLMNSTWEGKLQPQVEENITEVKWVTWDELNITELDSYLSIKDVLLQVKAAD
ncbi:MAG: NUDIX hydrolase [Bacteroidia bacterium]|nr:NUDIX hydrolase [Bacteroidia bacterium]